MGDFPSIPSSEPAMSGVLSTMQALYPYTVALPASAAYPSVNLGIFVPVRVGSPCIVYKLLTGAGATAGGNFDIGIYDRFGNRLVSSGATAKGSSVPHTIDITDTLLGTGLYYLAISASTTGNYILGTPSGTSPVPLQKTRMAGVLHMASAHPLPATATFAAPTLAQVPYIAAYLRPY